MSIATIILTVLITVVVYSLLAFTAANSKGCCNKLSGQDDNHNANSCCGGSRQR